MNIKTPSQRGAILIIVLWFIVIVTIIVAVLANETRLSAKVVLHNKIGMQTWSDILKALRVAEMELLINRMPDPPGTEEVPPSERKNKKYRFDGRILDLTYPIPETVTVRIYDNAGKINLQRLSKRKLRQLLEKRIGNDPEKLGTLLDAWQDWIDKDDLKRVNGAEKDYYETLSPPYEPRNSRIETVEELLLIKGFAEVFKEVEMDTAFTVYGNRTNINPNLATREALMLLPGIDEESVNTILTQRSEQEFKSHKDFNEFMEPEQQAEFRSWLNLRSTSNFYTIAVQVKKPEEIEKLANDDEDKSDKNNANESSAPQQTQEKEQAYMITVQFKGFNQFPKRLMVNPYGVLPDTRHEHLSSDDD
jgi:general secretion pathway protein K